MLDGCDSLFYSHSIGHPLKLSVHSLVNEQKLKQQLDQTVTVKECLRESPEALSTLSAKPCREFPNQLEVCELLFKPLCLVAYGPQ